jgi:hypothetical protein
LVHSSICNCARSHREFWEAILPLRSSLRAQTTLSSCAVFQWSLTVCPGPRTPRLSLSVALTECAAWVLNCERAYFVFGHTSFAKLRQKFRKHESVAGAISTVFLSHVKAHGILRNKDLPEISRPPAFLNQTDVLVNGVGRYAVELDPGAGFGRSPMKTPILLILGVRPDKRCRGDSMTFQQIQLSHGGETIPGVRGYHQARP